MGFWLNLFTRPIPEREVVLRHLDMAEKALAEVLSRFRLEAPSGARADEDEVKAYNNLKEAHRIVVEHQALLRELIRKYDKEG